MTAGENLPGQVERQGLYAYEHAVPELQREVQRLLGRCLVRLQQYERQLKSILAHHRLDGTLDELPHRRAERVEGFASDTLGTLLKELFESVVVPSGTQPVCIDERRVPADTAAVGYVLQIGVSISEHQRLIAEHKLFAQMRNSLVHHFIERFDIQTAAGCSEARSHLLAFDARIQTQIQQLVIWAKHIDSLSHAFSALSVQLEERIEQALSSALHVLFVCSQNKLRSPTAEQVFSEWPGIVVSSAGTNRGAETLVDAELVLWADLIFVMEKSHQQRLNVRFRGELKGKRVICLDIPDNYQFMQPELVRLLKKKVEKHLPRA